MDFTHTTPVIPAQTGWFLISEEYGAQPDEYVLVPVIAWRTINVPIESADGPKRFSHYEPITLEEINMTEEGLIAPDGRVFDVNTIRPRLKTGGGLYIQQIYANFGAWKDRHQEDREWRFDQYPYDASNTWDV